MVSKLYPDAPRVAVGAVVFHEAKVLLVLRGQAPSKGMWAIPGGSVELGESLQTAAEREMLEETGLHIKAGQVVYTFDTVERDDDGRIKYHYVIVDLLGEPLDPEQPLQPADDVDDARWFSQAELDQPTVPIAAPTQALLKKLNGQQ